MKCFKLFVYLLIQENLYPKLYLSGSNIGIKVFIPEGLCKGGLSEGANTWSNTSVKEKVGIPAGSSYVGGL